MAIQTYEASYRKYFGNTYDKIHKDSTHDEVRQVYDIWAVDYDKEIGAAGACFHKPLAECLDIAVNEVFPNINKTQLKILDAGAGTGPIGIELLKLGYTDIHALDISQEMLNIAKDKGVPYKRFICCPLTEKKIDELETGEFDALISAGTLIKANVRPEALVEMIRIVKTGGLVCFSLRYNEVDDYQPKMTELEEAGIWEKLSGKKIPYYNREDMPSYGFGFVYKILKN
ncbi:Methyltransferase domain [Porites harrisoni]